MDMAQTQPTARQTAYLSFIKAFTDRWGVPPSFEEIGRHFLVTAPSVSSMIKTLEARGFLSRVPGAARTLRVLVSDTVLAGPTPAKGRGRSPANGPATSGPATSDETAAQASTHAATIATTTALATVIIERLVPALAGIEQSYLHSALDAVAQSVHVVLSGAGASDAERRQVDQTLRRTASIAQGFSSETRPGRKLPWWQKPPR